MVRVSVAEPTRGTPVKDGLFVLEQDRWDDYGYKTQYHLHYFGGETDTFIGNVKILRRGQGTTVSNILPPGPLLPLGEDFCSVGQSLDYYERLASLAPELRDEILLFLRDVLSDPEHGKQFEVEEGWRVSLLREIDIDSYRPLAMTLLQRDYNALPSVGLALRFQVTGWTAPLDLDFAAPEDEYSSFGLRRKAMRLPERIAVLIGRNGSGKSTLLARLARVLHASQGSRNREELTRLGRIEPPGIGFTRVITIAYSAFDTFQIPGIDEQERRQMISDLKDGTGRYIFAGLRDIARELEERLAPETYPDEMIDPGALDRQTRTYLKPAEQLGDEYARMVQSVFAQDRQALMFKMAAILLADPSFSDIPEQSPAALFELDPKQTFMGWSTGHKIVMHALVTLVAYAQPKSIVLVDEPESHLHPPLLAALMHAIRAVLEEYDAFAVVATHSPVVAQETLGRHVSLVNRVGDEVTIVSPRIETYGESIGEVTDELFGLHAGATDFHTTLRAMVDGGLDLARIAAQFDRGMSLQARAYVMSLIASKDAV